MRQWLNRGLHILVLKIIDVILMAVFFPVVYFTLVGPMLCIVLSTLRVAHQDYGILDREASKANLKQGLNLYYYASVVHAAICLLYMVCEVAADQGIVVTVSQRHGFSVEVLDGYLRETKQKYLNDPASTVNWNLITYGAALLDSQLPEDYASGGRVLTMLIDQGITLSIRRLLIRSPRQRIQKLIGTLAWRSPDEREMRWFAALIVEHLAGHLNLAHFPVALECISSLFDPSCKNNGDQEALHLPFVIERSNTRKRKNLLQKIVKVLCIYVCFSNSIFLGLICLCRLKKGGALKNSGTLELESKQKESGEDLLLPGLRILENLAHNTQNCTLIYNSKDLLSKIVAPVSSKEFVDDIKSSAVWTKIVDGSLKVVSRLMGSSGSTGQKMRRLIANNSNAVKNLEAVLDMDMKSNSGIIELQMRVLDVLTQLALHHPASTSATKRREKLIERALHIFLTADWMGDYLEDEKRKIDKPTASQQNTLPRPSEGTCRSNRVKQVSGSRAKEKKAKRAAEAHVEKKMKEAQETASRLREKAGEALAMLSSDLEAIKSFTGCKDEDIHRLTELLDSRIKTIECKLSATDTVKIEISIICSISAAVILKHLSNYNKEPTLRKVLTELFQAEASSTPRCWECLLPNCCRNDIENQLDAGQDKRSASQRHNIEQCGERRLQAELISLVAAIRANSNLNFAAILISQPQPVALEDFVVRLKKMVEDNMYATPACLAIQKLTCEMVTGFIQNDRNVEVIDKHNIIGALLKASKVMAGLESSMLFAGFHHDCHGVPLKPLSCILAKRAEDILAQKKQVQAQGINSGLAGVSAA